jgi:hypothetical protein
VKYLLGMLSFADDLVPDAGRAGDPDRVPALHGREGVGEARLVEGLRHVRFMLWSSRSA